MGRRGGGGANARGANARDLKMYLAHGMWREHSYALIAVGVIVVACFGGALLQFSTSKAHVHRIEVTNPALLARVFRSGEPWVVLCAKPDDVVPDVFGKVAPRLVDKSFVGVLDCTQPLPQSGKSTLERYNIRASVSPTVFTVANGDKPQQVFLDHLQSSKALARRVVAQTKKSAKEVLTSAHLEQRCLHKSTCVLLLRGAKYSAYEQQWLDKLLLKHRSIAFAWVDATRLRLSIESMLPAFVAGEHRLVLFRRNRAASSSGVTAKAYRNVFDALPVGLFLDEHVQAASSSFKALSKAPTVARRKAAAKAAPSRQRRRTTSRGAQEEKTEQEKRRPTESAQPHDAGGDDDDAYYFAQHATPGDARPADEELDADDVEVIDLDDDDSDA